MWSSIRFEIKLGNIFPYTFSNIICWRLLIVGELGGATLGMKTSDARDHCIGTAEHLMQE